MISRFAARLAYCAFPSPRTWPVFSELDVSEVVAALDRFAQRDVSVVPIAFRTPEERVLLGEREVEFEERIVQNPKGYGVAFPFRTRIASYSRELVRGPDYSSIDVKMEGFAPLLQLKIPDAGEIGRTRFAQRGGSLAFLTDYAFSISKDPDRRVASHVGYLLLPS